MRKNDEGTEGLVDKFKEDLEQSRMGEGREQHKLGGEADFCGGTKSGENPAFLSTWREGSESKSQQGREGLV